MGANSIRKRVQPGVRFPFFRWTKSRHLFSSDRTAAASCGDAYRNIGFGCYKIFLGPDCAYRAGFPSNIRIGFTDLKFGFCVPQSAVHGDSTERL